MAKRRKAPKKATVSDSEEEGATEVHEPPRRWHADTESQQADNEAQSRAQAVIDDMEAAGLILCMTCSSTDHCLTCCLSRDAAVLDRVNALLRLADNAAASMSNELRVQLVKIPKQVRRAAPAANSGLSLSMQPAFTNICKSG